MGFTTVILQFICPDRPGLVSELAGWVAKHNGNIRHADHHTDADAKLFLSRIEWDLESFSLNKQSILQEVNCLSTRLQGKAKVNFSDELPRVAIFVSKQNHCLLDLLWRARSGELKMKIPLVISNHQDLESICEPFDTDFQYVPNTIKKMLPNNIKNAPQNYANSIQKSIEE